jgi:hypothetical protein
MASTRGPACDRCGARAGGPGAITVRFVDDRGLEQHSPVELCAPCARELGLRIRPADPPETEADDADPADDD